MTRVTFSARDRKLESSFTTLREALLGERFRDRLTKPLAYWALPNDRRLPLAFLNRSIGELISTPFEELTATPGIGEKKISSLVKLLMRATRDDPPATPFGLTELADENGTKLRFDEAKQFDACLVSEALWSKWTGAIRELNLGDEPLGRVAESLATMPTVIWTRSLGEYQNLSLAQIRGLRTHGEKRVRCVMQVVHRVYAITQLHRHEGDEVLRRRLGSQAILEVSRWLNEQLSINSVTAESDVRSHLAEPILKQISVDCGDTVYRIAQQRVGLDAQPMSVREQAQSMGVTRARIYQLLDDCHKILEVRWPQGKILLDRMTAKYGSYLGSQPIDASLFLAVRQLCFPDRNEQGAKSDLNDHAGSASYMAHTQTSFAADSRN